MRLRRVLHLVAMFAKAKARVRQFAGMDQVTCVDPVMDARFNRFQGMEKGLSTVYDAMGAYFAAHKALSRASTELSTALEAYHMDAIKAYSENELDNAVESSDACDPVAEAAGARLESVGARALGEIDVRHYVSEVQGHRRWGH